MNKRHAEWGTIMMIQRRKVVNSGMKEREEEGMNGMWMKVGYNRKVRKKGEGE